MQKQLKVTLLSLLGLVLPAFSQAYLDGREVLSLANASRYAEAFQLARKRPEAYGQWAALLIWHRILPEAYAYSTVEGYLRGYAEACRHMTVNKEAEAFCYRGIIDADSWRNYPEVARLLTEIQLPKISRQQAQQGLTLLERENVPYAILLNKVVGYLLSTDPNQRAKAREEARLQPLVERYPYSLGGAMAAGLLSQVLWERERYSEALSTARPVAGIVAAAGSVLAWAEYTGTGVQQNRQSACNRAHFWVRRSLAPAALYTLALCYLEGTGGFPKDPVEAYGVLWLGKNNSPYPGFAEKVRELEALLTPAQLQEGRRRAESYLR